MNSTRDNLLELLTDAVLREMKVSMQYMLQHTLLSIEPPETKAVKFIGTHYPVFLPGDSLKKIAVTEMRHAEAIAERLLILGGELPSQPPSYKIGESAEEIISIDIAEEENAVELYNRIIKLADSLKDEETASLFRGILSDEEKHLTIFTSLK